MSNIYAWAKEEIRRAWEADECVWTKLRRIEEYVTISKEDHQDLVDFCHFLLED